MNNFRLVASITEYIEEHLQEKITLEELASQLNYSKYYLLHEFKETTQQSLYNYIKRRRLNEAAKALLYSDQRIIEVAFQIGYQSQQAFTKAFEELFKLPPNGYRSQNKEFFIEEPYAVSDCLVWAEEREVIIQRGMPRDQEKILHFAHLMRGALPYLEKKDYLRSLKIVIKEENCYLAWAKGRIVGLLLFDSQKQTIENLTALPFCWDLAIEKKLLMKLILDKHPRMLRTTTFRAFDKLDIGHRKRLLKLGFVSSDETFDFNYPTEKMILPLTGIN
ncbi:helix-turn-helix transcriptional regulator [Candidatus Enterococcus murrayae]|uniref:Helix-turn-helix transcriptional regulator n=1 Tax=Candidatus Enterococcus murrayae TaxID=2815321 RepID=A0ABS3HG20_9ENTE|nr:AraC family transcriptional regulator [Enterococcus sp. MJM16]MBO0451967.1 helix-turn-helix transcriptional regulator [Enterococcus sp. MJM16]